MRVPAVLLLLFGCARNQPESVADRFVDYYFVEMDQGRALPLTAGLAHDMLERELRDVASIRREMGHMDADARPEVYYKRLEMRDDGARKVIAYNLEIKHGQDHMTKRAQVAVARERAGEAWKVVFFQLADGEVPSRPPQ
jgi:hypothetical protein